ncbi:hypothetical protein KIPB_003702 [Kipferlia bialata]|uniref:Uncharacterized protein n=1 Tax=Kipferlia bialata TaxID=797122 RepID=A0A9K3CRU0_9EUKA|nr:hypothetical protein KIPB_002124 [Kipferlia bialata]GIQ82542.1 hypothetical protein KIPB_003702 [Kipferlia bialata]|eukprot:g2124.t1
MRTTPRRKGTLKAALVQSLSSSMKAQRSGGMPTSPTPSPKKVETVSPHVPSPTKAVVSPVVSPVVPSVPVVVPTPPAAVVVEPVVDTPLPSDTNTTKTMAEMEVQSHFLVQVALKEKELALATYKARLAQTEEHSVMLATKHREEVERLETKVNVITLRSTGVQREMQDWRERLTRREAALAERMASLADKEVAVKEGQRRVDERSDILRREEERVARQREKERDDERERALADTTLGLERERNVQREEREREAARAEERRLEREEEKERQRERDLELEDELGLERGGQVSERQRQMDIYAQAEATMRQHLSRGI